MKPKHPLTGKRYHVASTDDHLTVISVFGDTVTCRYTNKDKPDVTTNIDALNRVLNFEVWKEV